MQIPKKILCFEVEPRLTSNAGFVNREEYAKGLFTNGAVDFPVAGMPNTPRYVNNCKYL